MRLSLIMPRGTGGVSARYRTARYFPPGACRLVVHYQLGLEDVVPVWDCASIMNVSPRAGRPQLKIAMAGALGWRGSSRMLVGT